MDTNFKNLVKIWDKEIKKYGVRTNAVGNKSDKLLEKENKVIRSFGINEPVLDVGCGYERLLTAFRDLDIRGIDISRIMLKEAKKFSKRVKYGNVVSIPFPNDFFRTVICIRVFTHLPYIMILYALREFKRILKPKGKIIFTVPKFFTLHGILWFLQSFLLKIICKTTVIDPKLFTRERIGNILRISRLNNSKIYSFEDAFIVCAINE